ncbi:MAG TPA: NUDIX hydrolase [Leptolyngbyaceae cyanobacterium M33_DOE_097]|uniref:NUDIX domain-containing protein n=1 Tax=Oscillatoriales cyanobacterium SpSt-418 TaxID=2282169 RepID=A0A7C3PFD4_9CYAN|nr:NUDIX hydrolase [Leptolyngbyaceae cyanobacterium M33_DOE_097]
MTSAEPIKVAIAILHSKQNFLLQLRDEIPTILYPGHWALFGGHIEPGELPEQAVQRELQEEIGFVPAELRLLDCYDDQQVMRYVFCGTLEVGLEQLCLGEGLDMGLATIDEIQAGERFSPKTGRFHPLGIPHRQILLNYIKTIR